MDISLNREVSLSKNLNRALGVGAFVVLMSLASFVRIPLPFTPVPITLQTFFVLLSGACLGPGLGAVSQLAYLVLGVAGAAAFTGTGSGLFYLAGPTGGYILGFILAAAFIGKALKPGRMSLLATAGIFLLGDAVLFFCGALWLKLLFGYSFLQAFILGVAPFAAGETVKILAAAGIYSRIQARVKNIF
ncbi:MAG: biotin transporter BioY [Candidatus Omnitrophica bacterium]|nr:biotin transporter BioY [Candidatus Omnitrophota bacterium]MDD5079416.1 biotin transporter BioY [Candidatus Omnitrophota bacterium]